MKRVRREEGEDDLHDGCLRQCDLCDRLNYDLTRIFLSNCLSLTIDSFCS